MLSPAAAPLFTLLSERSVFSACLFKAVWCFHIIRPALLALKKKKKKKKMWKSNLEDFKSESDIQNDTFIQIKNIVIW